jgi:hypothetical protein
VCGGPGLLGVGHFCQAFLSLACRATQPVERHARGKKGWLPHPRPRVMSDSANLARFWLSLLLFRFIQPLFKDFVFKALKCIV